MNPNGSPGSPGANDPRPNGGSGVGPAAGAWQYSWQNSWQYSWYERYAFFRF